MNTQEMVTLEMVYSMRNLKWQKRFANCMALFFGGSVSVNVAATKKQLEEALALIEMKKVL